MVLSETSVVLSYVPVSSLLSFRDIVEVCHNGREFRIPSNDPLFIHITAIYSRHGLTKNFVWCKYPVILLDNTNEFKHRTLVAICNIY